jgi:hypothetical protein
MPKLVITSTSYTLTQRAFLDPINYFIEGARAIAEASLSASLNSQEGEGTSVTSNVM